MASSGSKTTNSIGDFSITFSWNTTSQSITNNTSTIAWELKSNNTSGNYRTVYEKNLSIDGTNISISNSDLRCYNGTVIASGTRTISHNSDGTKSFNISMSFGVGIYSDTNISASQSFTLNTIPRYASFTSHYVSATTYNSISMYWASNKTIDRVQYSLNGGSWTTVSGSGKSGSYTISGLTAKTSTTTYSVKTRIRSSESGLYTESSSKNATTPIGIASFTTTPYVSATTLNSITIKYKTNLSINRVQYSLNGGSWVTTSGTTYTISGLTPNTYYTIRTKIRASVSNEETTSGSIGGTTKKIATLTGYNNWNSTSNPVITFSNPDSHSINIKLEFGGTSITRTNVTSSSPYTFTLTSGERDTLYSKCPNSNKLTVRAVIATMIGTTETYWSYSDKTMNVVSSNPTFSNFDYEDTNATTLALTGNSQKIIKKYSNVKITIDSTDKMVARNGATAKNYNLIVGSSKILNYSTSSINTTFNNANSNSAIVEAVDSRGNKTKVTKNLTIINYTEQILENLSFNRKDGVGETVLVTANGTYSTVNFGNVSNTIEDIKWRYRAVGGSYNSYATIKSYFDIADGEFANKSSNEISTTTFTLGTAYDIEVQITDKLSITTATFRLNTGIVLMDCVKDKGVAFGGLYDTSLADGVQFKKQIIMPQNQFHTYGVAALNMQNSDIIGCNSIFMKDESTDYEGICFLKQGGDPDVLADYETLRGYRGDLYYDDRNLTNPPLVELYNNSTGLSAGDSVTVANFEKFRFLVFRIDTYATYVACPNMKGVSVHIRGQNSYVYDSGNLETFTVRATRNSYTSITTNAFSAMAITTTGNSLGTANKITGIWGMY